MKLEASRGRPQPSSGIGSCALSSVLSVQDKARPASSHGSAFDIMPCWCVFLFALISVCFFASADEASFIADTPNSKCTIYLAESTIPNAGFGVYTTEAVRKGEVIIKADSPSIIITDIDNYQPSSEEPEWQHANYLWTAYGQGSFEAHTTHESVLTFGSLPNFHPGLKSAGPSGVERYDDTMFNRFKDAGAGATSYHMGHDFVAKYRDVAANEEIFVDYGEHWLDARDSEGFDKVPRAQEFKDAEAVIGMLSKALQEGTSTAADPIFHLVRGILEMYSNRTLSLIPTTIAKLEELDLSSENFLAHSKLERRSEEWIRTNGKCLDNVSPGRSTLSQAGMGGFAKRLMRKGEDVVPVPVLLISDSDILNMEEDRYSDEDLFKRITKYFGRSNDAITRQKQLLLNYCFGHGKTKMLFCPQSNAALVNHCSTRSQWGGQCDERGPNAALRWASDWDMSTAATLRLGLEEMSKQSSRGLILELYALRDILPGEEIFIDYGEDWEKAWLDHVENWQPPEPSSEFFSYQGVAEINSKKEANIRTISEEKFNPLPSNVMTGCVYWETGDEDETDWVESIDEDDIEDWKSLDDEAILELFGRPGTDYTGAQENKEVAEYWPCAVYMKNESNGTAVVRIFQSPSNDETEWESMGIPRFLTDYPMESIKFFHGPYKSDQHLPNAFRHHVGLPDNLIPDHWKETIAGGDAVSVCADGDKDPETCSIPS